MPGSTPGKVAATTGQHLPLSGLRRPGICCCRYSSAMKTIQKTLTIIALLQLALCSTTQSRDWVVYEGKNGPGKGKQIVFLTGDEEYRSEEGLPMLAKILAVRHGFKCTVLLPINPADGTIDPVTLTNI